jgi:hypothetical protein
VCTALRPQCAVAGAVPPLSPSPLRFACRGVGHWALSLGDAQSFAQLDVVSAFDGHAVGRQDLVGCHIIVPGNLAHPLPCLDLVTVAGGVQASGWRPLAVCQIIHLRTGEEGAAIIASHRQHPAVGQGCAFEGCISASWSALTMAPDRSAPLDASLMRGCIFLFRRASPSHCWPAETFPDDPRTSSIPRLRLPGTATSCPSARVRGATLPQKWLPSMSAETHGSGRLLDVGGWGVWFPGSGRRVPRLYDGRAKKSRPLTRHRRLMRTAHLFNVVHRYAGRVDPRRSFDEISDVARFCYSKIIPLDSRKDNPLSEDPLTATRSQPS